jgi:hypothetical protein
MSLPALPSTTDIRSITERVNAIIKQIYNKVIPVGADNYVLTSDGTTLAWEALPTYPITNTGATTFLGADVALNNTANFFNGPNTGSIGASGQVWFITATGTYTDTAGAATVVLAIFDGSAYIASSVASVPATSFMASHTLSAVVTLSAATTFTLRARDASSTSGVLQTSGSVSAIANKATSITAVRLA